MVPEMIKKRPVVVVSPRFRNREKLCTVIPLSSVQPAPLEPFHHELSVGAYPPARGPIWAKCDMMATVSLSRLDRVKVGHRNYQTFMMPAADMQAIRRCILHALGLSTLTAHI